MLEKDLICILEEEKKLLCSILELEEMKKESLIDRNLDRLIEINEKEERIFNEIAKYELTRNEIINKLREKFKLDREVTLSDLLNFIRDKGRLETLKDEIVQVIGKIKSLSFENKILIESAMNVSMGVIEKVMNVKYFEPYYDKNGRKEMKIDVNTYSTVG